MAILNESFLFYWRALLTAMAIFACSLPSVSAQTPDEGNEAPAAAGQRVALVIGQSDYRGARLFTGTADAGRMAEALEAAGFEVEGGADLEQYLIREKIGLLVEKARSSDGEATIFVYACGRVAQINGENILLPVGASTESASDVLLNGFRLNDLVGALRTVPAKARVIIIGAAAPPPQLLSDHNFSPGLAILEAPDDFLIAFNQNPGRPLPEPEPPTGLFSKALLDAMQQPVGSFADFVALARERVFEESHNHQMPWDDDKLSADGFFFFPPKDGTKPISIVQKGAKKVRVAALSRDQAFQQVIASDSITDYQDFLVKFPDDKANPTIQYNLAVRREAEVWARALKMNSAEGYWTYLDAYADGGNAEVARERLAQLSANPAPPPGFAPVAFDDLPPPLPSGELVASSASLPIEFFPPTRSLDLPPISRTVEAIAAISVTNAVGHELPRTNMPPIRPDWAAPPVRSTPHNGALGGTAPGPRADTPSSRPDTYRSIGGDRGATGGDKTVTPLSPAETIHPVPLPNQNAAHETLGHGEKPEIGGPPKTGPQGPSPRLGQGPPPRLGPQPPSIMRQGGVLQGHAIGRTGHAAPAQRRR